MKDRMVSLLFGIFLIKMSIQCQSHTYVTQRPDKPLNVVEGKSATISCSFQDNIDFKSFSFKKARVKLVQLCFLSNIQFDVSFSGTFENLKCNLETGGECTVTTEALTSTQDNPCSYPPEDTSQKFLYCENETFASIWFNHSYTSRIDISGNISNLNFTLQDLKEEDSGSFSCSGSAFRNECNANSTQIIVTKESSNTGSIIGISVGILASIIIFIVYIVKKKKRAAMMN